MFRLVETIKILNGIPMNLFWHKKRMQTSFINLFKTNQPFDPEGQIVVPEEFKTGLVKLRFIYNDHDFIQEYSHYLQKTVISLKVVEDNKISYPFKFADRANIEALKIKRGIYDDILIIKKGLVTDLSYANIVFFDGKKWYTPSSPLLRGTCRERLLFEGQISEVIIKPEDLSEFSSFRIINAMADFENQNPLEISNIHF